MSVLRATFFVSIISALGSVLSFANQLLLARYFGTSSEMDAYLTAISAPTVLSALVVGIFANLLVPRLLNTVGAKREDAIRSIALGVGGLTSAAALTLCLWQVYRAQHVDSSPTAVAVAQLSTIAWWWLPAAAVASLVTAALQLEERFRVATLLQIIPTASILLSCAIGARTFGVSALAWGQLIGYLFSIIAGLTCLRLNPLGPRQWAEFWPLLRQSRFSLAALLLFVLYPVSDASWGWRIGPAAVSYLGYSQRLIVGLSGLAVVGTTTVLFPRYTKISASGNELQFQQYVAASIRMMIAVVSPLATFLALRSFDILDVLLKRGRFTDSDVQTLGSLLRYMSPGMVAMSAGGLAFKALFARQLSNIAARISLTASLLYVTLSATCLYYGLNAIGAAYSIVWVVATVLAMRALLGDNMSNDTRSFTLFSIKTLCSCALAASGSIAIYQLIPEARNTWQKILFLGFQFVVGMILYVAGLALSNAVPEIRSVIRRVRTPS